MYKSNGFNRLAVCTWIKEPSCQPKCICKMFTSLGNVAGNITKTFSMLNELSVQLFLLCNMCRCFRQTFIATNSNRTLCQSKCVCIVFTRLGTMTKQCEDSCNFILAFVELCLFVNLLNQHELSWQLICLITCENLFLC